MRKLINIAVKEQKLIDVVCDCCGDSCRGTFNTERFESASIVGCFDEGDVAGDRFNIEICQECFFDLMEWFLLDKKGVVDYHNVVDGKQSATLDELRIFFSHRREGNIPTSEDYAEQG